MRDRFNQKEMWEHLGFPVEQAVEAAMSSENMRMFRKRLFSRIVPTLKKGAGVVTTRNDVHYVVTEFGVADLYGRSIRQRARALIDVAHPDFREELEACAAELKYL